MSGWASAAESMLRGEHCASSLSESGNATNMFVHVLTLLAGSNNTVTLNSHISFASTLRKMVWPFMRCNTPEALEETRVAWNTKGEEERREWTEKRREPLRQMQVVRMFPDYIHAILGMDRFLAGMIEDGDMSSCRFGEREPQTAEGGGERGAEFVPPSPFLHVHQLQAISLLTLTHICHWRLECEEGVFGGPSSDPPEWFSNIADNLQLLVNTDLAEFGALLLIRPSLSAPRSRTEVNVLCEQYAISHFSGRLMPGCCHMGCSNMSGFSEAALPTLLCSGCRRARYCSLGCQVAAWQEGGHSIVCKTPE